MDVAKSLYNQRKKMKRNLRRAFARPLIARARTHTTTPTHSHTHARTHAHAHTQCAGLFPFGITNNLIVRIDFIAVIFLKSKTKHI